MDHTDHISDRDQLLLLPAPEAGRRIDGMRRAMADAGVDLAVVRDPANIFWMTGRVFNGYIALTADRLCYLVRRPSVLRGPDVVYFHSMKDLLAILAPMAEGTLALETATLPWAVADRICSGLGASRPADLSAILRGLRAVKTDYEIERLEYSAARHVLNYRNIPGLYREGMTDIELQIEIERNARLLGCLGQFRMSGDDMDLFMGNVLTGDNADTPSPYDFAMGGRGISPSLPVGADGTLIRPGAPVMVDLNGNYCGYMTDMTRCYCQGNPPEAAVKAHRTSIEICHALAQAARPGVAAADLYNMAAEIADRAGLAKNFMGYTSHAGFVGHGIGIEVNEGPVLAPRSRDVLVPGNVLAIEPKFVLPGIGAVGIENTYAVQPDGPMRCLTVLDEQIIPLTD